MGLFSKHILIYSHATIHKYTHTFKSIHTSVPEEETSGGGVGWGLISFKYSPQSTSLFHPPSLAPSVAQRSVVC